MKATITVPTTLNDITLAQYRDFLEVSKNIEGEFLNQRMVEKLCNVSLADSLLIKRKDVHEIVNDINILFEKEQPLQRTFTLGKTKFGMIPNLDEMEFGEYIDLESNISDWQTINKAMAVLFRPIISEKDGKYEIEPYNGSATYSEVMLFLPIDIVQGAVVFFYHLGNELLKATQSYLMEEVQETLTMQETNLTPTGGGTTQSMQSLKETFTSLKKLLDSDYTSVLPS